MWITPKTDWKATDSFDLYTDYFRIKNNMLEVKKLVMGLYGDPNMIPLDDYGIADVGFADFYNNVERNIDRLADAGYRSPDIPPTKTWRDNYPVWTYLDLNRIERSLALMYGGLNRICRQAIPILLGGDAMYL